MILYIRFPLPLRKVELLFPSVERIRADPKSFLYFPDRVAPLGDLRDCISLELIAEIAAAHLGLLSSKLTKKASTIHGAITPNNHTQEGRARAFPAPEHVFTDCPTSALKRQIWFN